MNTAWKSANPSLLYCLILLLIFAPALYFFKDVVEPELDLAEDILPLPEEMPDFANILDVDLKKQMFFDFIEPYVDQVNAEILQQRARVAEIRDKVMAGQDLSQSDLRYLSTMAEQYEMEAEDLLAVCIQHELDHLNGKLFVDYLSPLKRNRIRKKLEKQQRTSA